jgi:hypothetical protein
MEEKINMDDIYAISGDVVARQIEGELIIVPLISGIGDMEEDLFTLNETGKAIWMKLNGKNSLAGIARDLAAEYESPPSLIEEDIRGLIFELQKRKMIIKRNGS